MSTALRYLSLVLTMALGGCVLPILGGDASLEYDEIALYVSEDTTRGDIEAYFASLDAEIRELSKPDDPLAIYYSTQFAGGFFFCAVGVFVGGCDGVGFEKDGFAAFQFDSSGRVADFEVTTRDRGRKCHPIGAYEMCPRTQFRPTHLVLRANEAGDRRAKQFSPAANACSIYVFAKMGARDHSFRIDDGESVLLHRKDFWLITANPGKHTATAEIFHPGARQQGPPSLEFECEPGQILFMDATSAVKSFSFKPHLELVREDVGRIEIEKRRLALAIYPY